MACAAWFIYSLQNSKSMKRREFLPPVVIPMVSIHPDRINLYNTVEFIDGHIPNRTRHAINKEDNNNRGQLSAIAKKKLERAVCYLNASAKERTGTLGNSNKPIRYKCTFITLTLSSQQQHPVNVITNNLLNQFLTEAKHRWKMTKYVWKAEFQRNGNLHYHILTDTFIDHTELRKVWNRIQNKLGYLEAYIANTGKKQPNSTDIHSLKNVKRISNYVMKYMSKGIGSVKEKGKAIIEGWQRRGMKDRRSLTDNCKRAIKEHRENYRIWGSSQHFANLKGAQEILEAEIASEIRLLKSNDHVRKFTNEHCEIIFVDFVNLNILQCPTIYKLFNEYLNTKFP
jgi:hypothetical protein